MATPAYKPGESSFPFKAAEKDGAKPPDAKGDAKSGDSKPGAFDGNPDTLKAALNEVDSIADAIGGGSMNDMGEGAGDMAGAKAAPEGGDPGTVLATALNVNPEKGKRLYNAAQKVKSTTGKSPEDLAAMLDNDLTLRMRLEEMAATSSDEADAEAPPADKGAPQLEDPAAAAGIGNDLSTMMGA